MNTISPEQFSDWMKRIMERFDLLENMMQFKKQEESQYNGEKLLDNQDLCFLLKVSKRTLQRYRSNEKLKYQRINQKPFYKKEDVFEFIREHFGDTKQSSKLIDKVKEI